MDGTLLGATRVAMRAGVLTVTQDGEEATLHVGADPLVIGRRAGCHLVLHDKKVSATHLEVIATEHGVRLRDLGSTNGTYVNDLRVAEALLQKEATIVCGDTTLEFHPGGRERVALSKSDEFGPLIGSTPAMRALFEKLRVISPTLLPVLIEGETGTGKELVARAIHEASGRAKGPLEVLDCGAMTAGLAESALFGHEKGAFTGAISRRISPFVSAAGGTVFLDELGELPLDVQPKLLRVLAEQRVKSAGSNHYVPIDVRVVAATKRNLLEEINRGTFRDDLYFRIAQARITVPPLRDRVEDIAPLVRRMMDLARKASAFRRVTSESLERLERHYWPGNVRELRSVVSLALAYDKGGPIALADHLNEQGLQPPRKAAGGPLLDRPYAESRSEHDRLFFTALYKATDGNLAEIARRAQINRETVRSYLRTLHIGGYRNAEE